MTLLNDGPCQCDYCCETDATYAPRTDAAVRREKAVLTDEQGSEVAMERPRRRRPWIRLWGRFEDGSAA